MRFYAGFFLAAMATLAQTSTFQFPPVGLAPSETAQVSVVSTTAAVSGVPAPSCTGTISFYNAAGASIGTATGFTVGSGQIFSATLPHDAAGGAGSRVIIAAQVAITAQPGCLLSSSLETWDTSSGATHLFYSRAAPQLLPAFRNGQVRAPQADEKREN